MEALANNALSSPPFSDHTSYLEWELEQVQLRVRAFIAARDGDQPVERFLALSRRLADARPRVQAWRQALLAEGQPMTFELLAQRFALQPLEEEALMVLMSMHLSANTRELLLHAQGRNQTHLELGFVTELLRPSRDLESVRSWADADARLVRLGLVQVRHARSRHLASRLGAAIETPHHLAAAVGRGQVVLDERLSTLASLSEARAELDDLVWTGEREILDAVVRALRSSTRRTPWRLLVKGDKQLGKTLLTHALTRLRKGLVLTLHCEALPSGSEGAELLRLSAHNAAFFDATWHLSRAEALGEHLPLLTRLLQQYPGLTVVEAREASSLQETLTLDAVLEIDPPDCVARARLWRQGMTPAEQVALSAGLCEKLAAQHALSGGQIRAAIAWARREVGGSSKLLTVEGLRAGARAQVQARPQRFTDRAQKLSLSLDHLVLPKAEMEQVRALLAACTNREKLLEQWGFGAHLGTRRGLVALFSGEPGTGKTLCAQILAHTLQRELRVVSIPQVMSKWVGETEKNVRALFREAETAREVLLFDEADSLFTKRVQVENAQDQLQNMEVNTLLQELERYEGVVFLTTNFAMNMDQAFARRILFKIRFPRPGAHERTRIWKALIPPHVPCRDDINFEALGKFFELSGGQICNAVLRAAYSSLEAHEPLSFKALSNAARFELTSPMS